MNVSVDSVVSRRGCGPLDVVCDKAGDIADAVTPDVIKDTASTVGTLASAASDPIGYLAEKAQAGARSLAEGVLPTLVRALEPDLSASWFVEAYRMTFAAAILVWALMLLWNLYLYNRRRLSGDDIADVLTRRSVIFLLGCAYGPPLGAFLISLIGALTEDVVAGYVLGSSSQQLADGVSTPQWSEH